MKATATYEAEPVSQWAAPMDTTAPAETTVADPSSPAESIGASVERNSGFDILLAAKTLGIELWNFFLLKVLFSYLVFQVLVPLSVVLTNDLSGIEFWTGIVTILAAPLCYAFCIARSEKPHLVHRLGIQAILFALCFILTSLVGFRGWSEGILLAAAAVGLLVGGAFLGSALRKEKTQKADSSSGASVLGFFKESIGGVLAIALGLGLCQGSRYAAASLEAQVQVIRCVGKPAPALNFVSADDEDWSLEDQQGKVTVVEYWSPHCMPCIAALGTLERIQKKFGPREDFDLVSVSTGSETSSVEMFETIENPWALVFPTDPEELGFEPAHIPMAYIIDRDGTVYAAGLSAEQLEEELSGLFEPIE